MPRLRVVSGPHAGASFDILAHNISIGRESGNTVALTQDQMVSRRHATISYENSRYVVRDSGSANGTFVNGTRITESAVKPGDALRVGGTEIRFVVE